MPAQTNLFAYRGGLVPRQRPAARTRHDRRHGPTQGLLLLFKIQVVSLDNRPLKIKIVDPADPSQSASAELDV